MKNLNLHPLDYLELLHFETFDTKNGNAFEVANTHIGNERIKNMAITSYLADKGFKVRLLHNNITDKMVYEKIMPTVQNIQNTQMLLSMMKFLNLNRIYLEL